MATLSDIRQTVIDWIEDDSDIPLIDRTINSQLRFVCKREFEALFKTVDIVPDADGIIVIPAASNAITGIYPQTSFGSLPSFGFMPRTTRPRADEPRTNRYLYHPFGFVETSTYSNINSRGFAGDSVILFPFGAPQGVMGLILNVRGDSTDYLITSEGLDYQLYITPPLVADISSNSVTIDPAKNRAYVLTDPSGNIYTDTVTVDYQAKHQPLISDDDELYIPMERTLALLTVQQFLQQSKYDVDAERLDKAIFEARLAEYGTEPSNRQDNAPKDTMFSFRSKRGGRNRR